MLMAMVLSLVVASCSPFVVNTAGYEYHEMSLDEAWMMTSQYEYKPDIVSHTKSPIDFANDGGGDCEDFTVYMMYLLGDESWAVLFWQGNGLHMIVYYDGMFIEPQEYGVIYENVDIYKAYSYEYMMGYATGYGTRHL